MGVVCDVTALEVDDGIVDTVTVIGCPEVPAVVVLSEVVLSVVVLSVGGEVVEVCVVDVDVVISSSQL